MKSLLEQLENNEAILLMYLADELAAEDRREVEHMLRTDSGLREQLASLQNIESTLSAALTDLADLALPPATRASREAAATRQISRLMTRARLEQEQRPATILPISPSRSFQLPSWSYPFAAAAMIIVGCIAYWGFTGGTGASHRVEVAALPDPNFESSPDGQPTDGASAEARQSFASLPSLGVDDGDRDLLAVSAGSYDVSSMFEIERE
jgi:anti-sigma factor RsiW